MNRNEISYCLEEMEDAKDDCKKRERNFLRKCGWEYTSDTPGALWLWQKKMPDGRTMLVNDSTAMWIEEYRAGEGCGLDSLAPSRGE